ncbi:hypothetical protein EII14_08745 [Alloprevotella sp. OH1205_COT-284]|uniref:hypothetical protein n=1 Tax=Alloprevotella sp. OH1205_COT-284 TaxID=2491043 RepID=UPI000F5FCEFB|nr:hypothetical protein [Alloprevotella sp. OH1205_COT-284]RRD75046.1 hypothetical protein EII14_08745 [Alloprevotella sp. OH1205_COT-284]
MIERIFHPIGQGAFYSERHTSCNINIVYDCGTTNPRLLAKQRVVSQSFRKDDVIHILFISHFDKDHISLIDTLKKAVKKIERVVLPLLHDEQKIFLSNIYKALGQSRLAKLVSDPNDFFGIETQIIGVRPSSDTEIGEIPSLNVLEINETRTEIQSGTPLTINGFNDWVYIPFNYQSKTRSNEFQNKLHNEGIDVGKLKTYPDYLLYGITDVEKKKIIGVYNGRGIYKGKGVSGNINENSMFLYSGPSCKKDLHKHSWIRGHYSCDLSICYIDIDCHSHRVACLYTGDGDLNKVDIRKLYGRYWDLIGTIQIPHHGSGKSFKATPFDKGGFLCPMSVGNKNPYRHPSPIVISELFLKRNFPILVTEDSTFEEDIH